MFGFLYAPTKSCGTTARGFYQSTFCGLACQMHRDYGPLARFLINRDSTFLALAGVSLDNSTTALESRTCCNPLANKKPVVAADRHLQYAAAITVCGLSTKLRDNADDERGWRAGVPRIAGNLMAPARDTATAVLNSCGFPVRLVESLLSEQQQLEANGADMVAASEPTAQSYGTIFSHLANQSGLLLEKPRLFQLGSSLGRLIYWQDAIDDQKSDAKHGRFNPLNLHSTTDAPGLMKAEFAQLKDSVHNIAWQRNEKLITDIIGHTQVHQESGQSKSAALAPPRKINGMTACVAAMPYPAAMQIALPAAVEQETLARVVVADVTAAVVVIVVAVDHKLLCPFLSIMPILMQTSLG